MCIVVPRFAPLLWCDLLLSYGDEPTLKRHIRAGITKFIHVILDWIKSLLVVALTAFHSVGDLVRSAPEQRVGYVRCSGKGLPRWVGGKGVHVC
jgi:hypothetical protein